MFNPIEWIQKNRCRKQLHEAAALYLSLKGKLSQPEQERAKKLILDFENGINTLPSKELKELRNELTEWYKKNHPRSWIKGGIELVGALAFALVIATVIRQMWFEPFEIPTGSMRPTFKEQDHLTVSKTQFGINTPLQTSHLYFNPDLVQRSSAIIFSGDGIPLPDTDTTFLGIFPYKKRYIKRLMAKPEDKVLFYGGKVYVKAREGQFVDELLESPWMNDLEYIPMISFEGVPRRLDSNTIGLFYFNKLMGKITQLAGGDLKGEVFNGKQFVPDELGKVNSKEAAIHSLSDLFGMKYFAILQLMTRKELKAAGLESEDSADYFLVLRHTPHLDFSNKKAKGQRFPLTLTSLLPLNDKEMETLGKSLYTSRFIVKDGKAYRYHYESAKPARTLRLAGIPDGTYEFDRGTPHEVYFGGISLPVSADHPLRHLTQEQIALIFNAGQAWDPAYLPDTVRGEWPQRYAYFRDKALYVMGAPLLKSHDPKLVQFIEAEKEKEKKASPKDPYIAFTPSPSPLELSREAFNTYALSVPPKGYLALGDNHAMSGDSRFFGFVPEENLQGVPEWIVWPPGSRWGRPEQKPYPVWVEPRMIVWSVAAILGLAAYAIYCYRLRKKVAL